MRLASYTGAWYAILEASGIGDHDTARADARFAAWLAGGRRGRRPAPWSGGECDAWRALSDGVDDVRLRPCGQLEAFHGALRAAGRERAGNATWQDVAAILPVMRDLPGFADVRLPDHVIEALADLAWETHCAREPETETDRLVEEAFSAGWNNCAGDTGRKAA